MFRYDPIKTFTLKGLLLALLRKIKHVYGAVLRLDKDLRVQNLNVLYVSENVLLHTALYTDSCIQIVQIYNVSTIGKL